MYLAWNWSEVIVSTIQPLDRYIHYHGVRIPCLVCERLSNSEPGKLGAMFSDLLSPSQDSGVELLWAWFQGLGSSIESATISHRQQAQRCLVSSQRQHNLSVKSPNPWPLVLASPLRPSCPCWYGSLLVAPLTCLP